MEQQYDVVVVGGGAAGLSGAKALSRSRRSVLVVDAGQQRNRPAGHVHNYLGREGTPPAELMAIGRSEVEEYGGEVIAGRVSKTRALDGGGFTVELADGREVGARRLLVTTGLVDELPDVAGLAERWGKDVLHCPFCHGWEVRDQAIGVLATGPMTVHQALMFRQLSADVTVFAHTGPAPTMEEHEQFHALGIRFVEGEVVSVEVKDDELAGVRLASGEVVGVQALVVSPRFTARADLLTSLGLESTVLEVGGHALGSYIESDAKGQTAVPGVWVAGNVTDLMAQVVGSAAAGLQAGAAINGDLIAEDAQLAVADHREQQMNSFLEASTWEERYSSSDAVWSGRPNPQLVDEASDLAPGSALDVGCGEGADALWLAMRGWQVTAADFSKVALRKGAAHAETLGAEVAARLDWRHADLNTWRPPEQHFDLIAAHFMHLPEQIRREVFAGLAAGVTPGGTLLIVGHSPLDLETTMPRPRIREMFYTPDQLVAELDPAIWEVLVAESRPRQAQHPHGEEVTLHDTVLRARRRSAG